jgi:hypothetical protein
MPHFSFALGLHWIALKLFRDYSLFIDQSIAFLIFRTVGGRATKDTQLGGDGEVLREQIEPDDEGELRTSPGVLG